MTLGLDRYGGGAINWVPDTWVHEIADDCGVVLPQRNRDRLSAACTLLQRPDEFYTSAASFTDIIQGLAAEWFDTHVWHPPTVHECTWGLIEAHLISPPDPGERFSPEIVRYVNMIVRNDGFRTFPRVLKTFGVPEEAGAQDRHDYSEDPELEAVTTIGSEERDNDLARFVADRLRELADRVLLLPLENGRNIKVVVDRLRRAATGN